MKRAQHKEMSEAERRRRDLAMIHIAARDLGYSNAKYRALILRFTDDKKLSAGDMTAEERRNLIDFFKKWGWRPVSKNGPKNGRHWSENLDRGPMLSKINAILRDLDLPWTYADGIAKKMFGVDFVHWLDNDQVRKVTLALIYHQRRQKQKKGKVLALPKRNQGCKPNGLELS